VLRTQDAAVCAVPGLTTAASGPRGSTLKCQEAGDSAGRPGGAASHASFHDLRWDVANPTGVKKQGGAESCKKDPRGHWAARVVFQDAPSFCSTQRHQAGWQPVAGSRPPPAPLLWETRCNNWYPWVRPPLLLSPCCRVLCLETGALAAGEGPRGVHVCVSPLPASSGP